MVAGGGLLLCCWFPRPLCCGGLSTAPGPLAWLPGGVLGCCEGEAKLRLGEPAVLLVRCAAACWSAWSGSAWLGSVGLVLDLVGVAFWGWVGLALVVVWWWSVGLVVWWWFGGGLSVLSLLFGVRRAACIPQGVLRFFSTVSLPRYFCLNNGHISN